MPAMRAFLSGPWQRKQVSDMIGRTSRLKLIRSPEAGPCREADGAGGWGLAVSTTPQPTPSPSETPNQTAARREVMAWKR